MFIVYQGKNIKYFKVSPLVFFCNFTVIFLGVLIGYFLLLNYELKSSINETSRESNIMIPIKPNSVNQTDQATINQ